MLTLLSKTGILSLKDRRVVLTTEVCSRYNVERIATHHVAHSTLQYTPLILVEVILLRGHVRSVEGLVHHLL